MDSKNISSLISKIEEEKENIIDFLSKNDVSKKRKTELNKRIKKIDDERNKLKGLENDVLKYEDSYMSI
jgi:cell shape-determining protein MreC